MSQKQTIDMGGLYLKFLQAQERAAKAIVPSEQSDALREASQIANEMIERLALLGAALNANFEAISKKIAALEKTNPGLLAQIDQEIGSLVGLRNVFLGFYQDEADFCGKFELMVRERMLSEAGVDPKDPEASMKWLITAGAKMHTAAAEKN